MKTNPPETYRSVKISIAKIASMGGQENERGCQESVKNEIEGVKKISRSANFGDLSIDLELGARYNIPRLQRTLSAAR